MARPMAHAYVARGLVVPPPQTIRALIDTGADRTAIHPNALALIASPPSGTIRVRRPGQAAIAASQPPRCTLAFGGAVVPPTRGPWIELESATVVPADPECPGADRSRHARALPIRLRRTEMRTPIGLLKWVAPIPPPGSLDHPRSARAFRHRRPEGRSVREKPAIAAPRTDPGVPRGQSFST